MSGLTNSMRMMAAMGIAATAIAAAPAMAQSVDYGGSNGRVHYDHFRDRGGDHHQCHVFCVLKLQWSLLTDRVVHPLKHRRQPAHGRQEIRSVARAGKTDHQSHALDRVFFLAFDAANVADAKFGGGGRGKKEREEYRSYEFHFGFDVERRMDGSTGILSTEY